MAFPEVTFLTVIQLPTSTAVGVFLNCAGEALEVNVSPGLPGMQGPNFQLEIMPDLKHGEHVE